MSIEGTFRDLGLVVFQRGWLSSNNVLFRAAAGRPSALVDSGYVSHAEQTVSLVDAALRGDRLGLLINTHLHSDHCGGNSALQRQHGCRVLVPHASLEVVQRWNEDALSFNSTGQRCDRFAADGGICPGEAVMLGACEWTAIGAPGHDPDSLVFFQSDSRVLISADALWEERLAIIFAELEGGSGFREARAALAMIEALDPAIVIPGHGRPFTEVGCAILRSRQRIDGFEREPFRHAMYGARALTMFHMLEHRTCTWPDLQAWLSRTPVFIALHLQFGSPRESIESFSETLIRGLIESGQLSETASGYLQVAAR